MMLPLTPAEQAALTERIRKGDESAEEQFVQIFRERIFVMLLARTRDAESSRELTQEVLAAVLRALRNGRVQQPERLAAFVHGTAQNLVNNYLRGRAQRPQEVPLRPDLAVTTPCSGIEASERLSLVRQALERLDATDRRILLMTLVEGLKPGEIAQELGLKAELVRQRKSRAIKKVIERLRKMSRK